ncbi:MAG: SPOR domain-containing protein [Flavobacteriales bacterium]|nr:SPOR domain-containing protein [Flavobacteriales bacterium]
MKYLSVLLFFSSALLCHLAVSQTNSSEYIMVDAKINHYLERYRTTYKLSGFRIQIHSGSKKEDARKVKTSFLQHYPKTKAYEIYQQPNFRVRVGNFTSRLEATKFLMEIQKHYPNAYIVPEDKIDIQISE